MGCESLIMCCFKKVHHLMNYNVFQTLWRLLGQFRIETYIASRGVARTPGITEATLSDSPIPHLLALS